MEWRKTHWRVFFAGLVMDLKFLPDNLFYSNLLFFHKILVSYWLHEQFCSSGVWRCSWDELHRSEPCPPGGLQDSRPRPLVFLIQGECIAESITSVMQIVTSAGSLPLPQHSDSCQELICFVCSLKILVLLLLTPVEKEGEPRHLVVFLQCLGYHFGYSQFFLQKWEENIVAGRIWDFFFFFFSPKAYLVMW